MTEDVLSVASTRLCQSLVPKISGVGFLALILTVLFSAFRYAEPNLPNIKPPSLKVKTVVIDAGHGGKDPGCHGNLSKEKDIALAVALKLGKFIEDNCKDVKVIFTRKTDVFIELNERAAIANRNHADLFICIHCNSACVVDKRTRKETCNEDIHGAETYVMGIQKNAGNLDVSRRENQSILMEGDYKKNYDGFDPNSDEANIIFTFYQNVYRTQSLNLAAKIQACYKEKSGRKDKGVQEAPFLVLWRTAMPSLLTEIGFLTNHKEEKFLGSEKGQRYMATSLFRAFRIYKNEVEGTNIKFNDSFEKMEPYDAEKDTIVTAAEKINETKPEKDEKNKSDGDPNQVKPRVEKPKQTEKIITTPDDKYDPANDESRKNDQKLNPTDIKANSSVKDSTVKDETVYKVLFYSTDTKLTPDDKVLKDVAKVDFFFEGGKFKYTSGEFSKMKEAAKCQSELRKMGFKDAFVVCFVGGKRKK